jgi:heme/copper-type cytochrome/quinol oxidase subunit 2
MTSETLVELIPTVDPYEKHTAIMIWVVKVGGILSIIATSFTMRDILTRFLQGETIRLTSKLIFEWALACMGGSFWSAFMSTWMVPEESGIYMASGNQSTCTLQGFLDSFFYGITVLTYTVLAITYCLLVKFKRKDELSMSRNLILILGISPTICFLLATAPLFNNAYNYTELHTCGLAEYPLGCLSHFTPDCERGENARKFWITRFFIVCWANFFIIVAVVVLIRSILARESRMNQHERTNESRSKKVMWQGIWYILAFEVSWGAWYAFQFIRISADIDMNSRSFYELDVSAILYIASVTYPTQGVWISMVYFRPKYLKFRQRIPDDFMIASVLRVLNLSVPRYLTTEWWDDWKNDRPKKNVSANESQVPGSGEQNDECELGNNVSSFVSKATDGTRC